MLRVACLTLIPHRKTVPWQRFRIKLYCNEHERPCNLLQTQSMSALPATKTRTNTQTAIAAQPWPIKASTKYRASSVSIVQSRHLTSYFPKLACRLSMLLYTIAPMVPKTVSTTATTSTTKRLHPRGNGSKIKQKRRTGEKRKRVTRCDI